jgi:ketosteroid isomerase-like protein
VEPDPLSVVTDYLAALEAFDYDRARACLADDGFEFTSPIHHFQSADAFIEYITGVGGIVHSTQTRKVFVDGEDLCHILTYRIQISEKQDVTAALWTRVRGGRIARIEAIFDASIYRELFPTE